MTRLDEALLVAFDTETTGVDVRQDRIVSAAVIARQSGQASCELGNWLINPGIRIPQGAVDVHGLTNEYVQRYGAQPADSLDELARLLVSQARQGGCLVVFNASYDLVLLEYELRRHELPGLIERLGSDPLYVVDPLVLDRALVEKRRGNRRLDTLCQIYGVNTGEAAHDAAADSRMTLGVLEAMMGRFDNLGAQDISQLQLFQARAHARWARDFNRWRRSRGYSGDPAQEVWLPWLDAALEES